MTKWTMPYLQSYTDMVKEYMEESQQDKDPKLYATLITEEFRELCLAATKKEEVKELADLIYVIFGYAYSCGYDLEEAIRRVHQNNMDRMRQDDGSVLFREDGKVVKNPNTPKVDLEGLY